MRLTSEDTMVVMWYIVHGRHYHGVGGLTVGLARSSFGRGIER